MKKSYKGSCITVLTAFSALGLIVPMAAFAAGPTAVTLGTAGNYAILAKTAVSTTGSTSVVGDIGISPAAASYITGFGLDLAAYSAYATSALVTGKIYAPGYTDPTPANITTAVSDMETAYTDAAGRTNPTATELGAGNIGGMTLVAGTYKWGTDVTIPTDVTLSGGANDVWIFQIAGKLDMSSATKVVLSGGAQAKNIFWAVAGQTTLGTTAVMNGIILDQTAIVMNTGATLNGRALAQSAVTMDANTVTAPSSTATVSVTAATPATPATPAVSATPSTSTSSGTSATPAVSATPATPSAQSTQTTSAAATPRLSATQIQAILNVLSSFNADASVIAKVRTSLEGATTGSVTSAAVAAFKANLTVGSLGSEVKALQEYLNEHGYTVATSGAGSPGNETTRFGAATKAALIKYQKAKGITPAVGYFGPTTRAAINAGE